MTERLVKKTLLVPLTEKELIQTADKATEIHSTLAHTRFEAKESTEGYKNRIAGLQDDLNKVMTLLRNKREMREVNCLQVMDYEKKIVNYILDGVLVDSKPMGDGELQVNLF